MLEKRHALAAGSDLIERVSYDAGDGKLSINDAQSWNNVAPNVANFRIGGYVVAEKWLKDRKNRKLSYDERVLFPQILIALAETAKIMDEIALADDTDAT